MSIEAITEQLSPLQRKFAVGGVCGILAATLISAATPVKVPFWVGLLVSLPTVWATDWRGRQRTQQEAEQAFLGRISPEYAAATDTLLGNLQKLPPGSERAQAARDAAKLLDHAAGRVVAETFLQVQNREAQNHAPISMSSDYQKLSSHDAETFDSAPTELESEVDFDSLLQSWEREFPDAPIAPETPTSAWEEVLPNHYEVLPK